MAKHSDGKVYVPCEQCGYVNTLRQVEQPLTHEERLLARICRMIDTYDTEPRAVAGIVARDMAKRLLRLFDPSILVSPEYRMQVYSDKGWRTLKLPLYDLH